MFNLLLSLALQIPFFADFIYKLISEEIVGRLIVLFFILKALAYANIAEVVAISGKAVLIRDNQEISLKQQSKIEEKDIIKTMQNSKVQIVFEDETIISLGQKTTFEISEYLFSQTKPKAKFNISRGLFKSITGKIGKIAPKNFQLKTQNATIGVRGTTILGETSKEGDSIICSSGKIIVSTKMGEVIVNMGEKTFIKRGSSPTPAVKISPNLIIEMDQTVKATQKEPKTKEEVTQKVDAPKKISQKITDIKNSWGDWSKEDIIAQELKNKTPVKYIKPDPDEVDKIPDTTEKLLPQLQNLRDRAGVNNPTYSGTISGFVDNPILPSNRISNGNINLNFDLGQGTMQGDMKFEATNQQWSADIQNGTVDKRGKFDFGINGNNLKGDGDGMLSGENLEHANGIFKLKNSIDQREAYGTFKAER